MNIVVIGAGVMGAGIAAQIANAGFKVSLLDIVLASNADRNILAKNAIAKLGSALMCPEFSENIIPGNLEDDLKILSEADWIIEVIIEKLAIKQDLYKKLEQYCKPSCIISSNTSTIPLLKLIEGRNKQFKRNFLITHFFNPPRNMQLLELVTSQHTDKEVIKIVTDFIDIALGKTVIKSNDTPGFIANRIGCYFLETALTIALEMEISVEEADGVLGKPVGIPKTAIFGLYDLIGLDVMKLISASLISALNSYDDFALMSKSHQLLEQMIKDGFVGRKGKGGFYRIIVDEKGNKIKEVINLKTGVYAQATEMVLPINGAKDIFAHNNYAYTAHK
jgi:3-hydroxyacyl-CoA dehydrogenase